MAKPKFHSCKVGAQPWLVVLKGRCKPIVGRMIEFRRHDESPGRWSTGQVTKVNADGYFYVDLM